MNNSPQDQAVAKTSSYWANLVQPASNPSPDTIPSQKAREEAPPEGKDKKGDSLQEQTVKDMEANRGLRDRYAGKAYEMATGCLCAWFVLLGVHGIINAIQMRPMYSDKVIIAVTSGVTVSVLAAFLGVIRGLFPSSTKDKTDKG
ncbi:hypothetical protein KIK84_05620 [Curvibacter sp. CHRR-16]|uniref:hypothetical protein n=1 Tax=Curvibacter sp. CHRR-16 TaxID=2835872 RepID=UPI001BDA3BA8|nr:hypothetical protein [Curvibacter sp. CHRR-16]MBT0569795.1 hypothetical protein [Curvibacter sp. CHRR-16]